MGSDTRERRDAHAPAFVQRSAGQGMWSTSGPPCGGVLGNAELIEHHCDVGSCVGHITAQLPCGRGISGPADRDDPDAPSLGVRVPVSPAGGVRGGAVVEHDRRAFGRTRNEHVEVPAISSGEVTRQLDHRASVPWARGDRVPTGFVTRGPVA